MSDLRFASLGSGSGGNATVVSSAKTTVLVDCGFSSRQIVNRLTDRGVDPHAVSKVLITHEHSDHKQGVGVFARQHKVEVWASGGTLRRLDVDIRQQMFLEPNNTYVLGEDLEVDTVSVPHDSAEPLQYVFRSGSSKFGLLTDCGHCTAAMISAYSQCSALFIESNHDLDMLQNGPYPSFLKERVGGAFGHLNNDQTRAFLDEVVHDGVRNVVIGHISQHNNHVDVIAQGLESLARRYPIQYASQEDGTQWVEA